MIILYHRAFEKRFALLDVKTQEQFYKRLRLFWSDKFHPQLNNHQLAGKYSEYRSINITGDYRALYKEITDEVVEFKTIDTHSNLYL